MKIYVCLIALLSLASCRQEESSIGFDKEHWKNRIEIADNHLTKVEGVLLEQKKAIGDYEIVGADTEFKLRDLWRKEDEHWATVVPIVQFAQNSGLPDDGLLERCDLVRKNSERMEAEGQRLIDRIMVLERRSIIERAGKERAKIGEANNMQEVLENSEKVLENLKEMQEGNRNRQEAMEQDFEKKWGEKP